MRTLMKLKYANALLKFTGSDSANLVDLTKEEFDEELDNLFNTTHMNLNFTVFDEVEGECFYEVSEELLAVLKECKKVTSFSCILDKDPADFSLMIKLLNLYSNQLDDFSFELEFDQADLYEEQVETVEMVKLKEDMKCLANTVLHLTKLERFSFTTAGGFSDISGIYLGDKAFILLIEQILLNLPEELSSLKLDISKIKPHFNLNTIARFKQLELFYFDNLYSGTSFLLDLSDHFKEHSNIKLIHILMQEEEYNTWFPFQGINNLLMSNTLQDLQIHTNHGDLWRIENESDDYFNEWAKSIKNNVSLKSLYLSINFEDITMDYDGLEVFLLSLAHNQTLECVNLTFNNSYNWFNGDEGIDVDLDFEPVIDAVRENYNLVKFYVDGMMNSELAPYLSRNKRLKTYGLSSIKAILKEEEVDFSELHYVEKNSTIKYSKNPVGTLSIPRFIKGDPVHFKSPISASVIKQKSLILADWWAESWDECMVVQVKLLLHSLMEQGFKLYVWQNPELVLLKNVQSLTNNTRQNIRPELKAKINTLALSAHHLTHEQVYIIQRQELVVLLGDSKENPRPIYKSYLNTRHARNKIELLEPPTNVINDSLVTAKGVKFSDSLDFICFENQNKPHTICDLQNLITFITPLLKRLEFSINYEGYFRWTFVSLDLLQQLHLTIEKANIIAIINLFRAAPKIEQLTLHFYPETLEQFNSCIKSEESSIFSLRVLTKLKWLELEQANALILQHLLQQRPKLDFLSLKTVSLIENIALSNTHPIQSLYLKHCTINAYNLALLLKGCKHVSMTKVTIVGEWPSSLLLPDLETLRIIGSSDEIAFEQLLIEQLLNASFNLTSLWLLDSEYVLKTPLPNLEHLSVSYNTIENGHWQHQIGQYPRLGLLHIHEVELADLSEDWCLALNKVPKVRLTAAYDDVTSDEPEIPERICNLLTVEALTIQHHGSAANTHWNHPHLCALYNAASHLKKLDLTLNGKIETLPSSIELLKLNCNGIHALELKHLLSVLPNLRELELLLCEAPEENIDASYHESYVLDPLEQLETLDYLVFPDIYNKYRLALLKRFQKNSTESVVDNPRPPRPKFEMCTFRPSQNKKRSLDDTGFVDADTSFQPNKKFDLQRIFYNPEGVNHPRPSQYRLKTYDYLNCLASSSSSSPISCSYQLSPWHKLMLIQSSA